MSRLSSLMPTVRTVQYVLIAVIAFSLGGATVVQAVAPGGILGVVRLADRTDDTQLAAVDAAGNVAVKVSNFPATQNVNVLGGSTAAPTGRLIIVMRDQDVTGNHRVEAPTTENVSDCRSLAVLIEQPFIGPVQLVGGLMLNGDGGSKIQTLMGGSPSGSVFWFNVPGTSMPVVAPFARVFVDNVTDETVHFGRVWLYCAR